MTSIEAAPRDRWPLPAGWRTEVIRFPLEFAPGLAFAGVEELRFAPGFFDPAAPGYWSYAFTWRLERPSGLDGPGLAAALVVYFRGLTVAVDDGKRTSDPSAIAVEATPRSTDEHDLAVVTYDPFTTGAVVRLTGRARRTDCGDGRELWTIGLTSRTAPAAMVTQVATLYRQVACGQAPVQAPANRSDR